MLKYLLLLVPGLAAAQVPQSFTFTLQGQLDPRLNAPAKVYLSFNGWQDSATVSHGKFKLQGRVVKNHFSSYRQPYAPGRAALVLSRQGRGASREFEDLWVPGSFSVTAQLRSDRRRVYDPQQKADFIDSFYLEPGTVTFNSPDSLKNAQVSGPRFTTEWQEWAKVEQLYPLSRDAYKLGLVRFVESHPASLVGLDVLTNLSYAVADSALTRRLFGLLAPALRRSPAGQQIAAQLVTWAHPLAIGQLAPYFKLPTLRGVAVGNFPGGGYILLNFYTSTSAACQAENEELARINQALQAERAKLRTQLGSNGFRFGVYNIAVDGPTAQAAWLAAGSPPYANALLDQPGPHSVASLYEITATPQNYLLDAQNRIVARNIHGPQLQALLEQELKKTLEAAQKESRATNEYLRQGGSRGRD
ncbi:MAG: hypothetical protein ACRYFX_16895 [Janthinobacterium lividum]